LTPNYEYIAGLREKRKTQQKVVSSSKNVLILGAGYVSEPVVEYLQRDQNISVTLGIFNLAASYAFFLRFFTFLISN
jgi:alpha-aminoadipic semialdehyde synthase